MQIIHGHRAAPGPLGPLVMTIGTFDGVHVGHRAIIERIVDRARKTGTRSLVYSFFPPPWRVVGRERPATLILTLQDKIELLGRMGVDVLLTEEFDPELRTMSHSDFASVVLRDLLDPLEIHLGYDFRFGRDRLGDAGFLSRFFSGSHTAVRQHGAVRVGGEVVGCTMIRGLVGAGDMRRAAAFLGRWHFVRGAVVRGRGRGATIGVPTANVSPATELVPPPGVYAVGLEVGDDGKLLPGVANLGFRPTFAETDFSLEVHLFDFSGSLYGERVRVHFVERVRDERRFEDAASLVRQIRSDTETVRGMLPFPRPPEGELTWDPKPDGGGGAQPASADQEASGSGGDGIVRTRAGGMPR